MPAASQRRRTQLRWWAGRGPAAVLAAAVVLLATPHRGKGSVTHWLPTPGLALRFDGHGTASAQGMGLVELPRLTGSSNTTITVSVWARIEKHKTHNLLASSGSREAGWALFVDKGEQALFGLWQQRSLQTVSTRPLQQGSAWHFISGTYDGHALRVWVDADMGEEVPLPGARMDTPWSGATIGGAADWPQLRMEGDIGPVTIWAEARSGEQLARDMMGVPDLDEANLVGRWDMRAPAPPGVLVDSGPAQHNATFPVEGGPILVNGGYPGFLTGDLSLAEEGWGAGGGLRMALRPGPSGSKLRLAEAPSGEEGRLVVGDPDRFGDLGEPPELPWPLVPQRSYTFYPNASRAAADLEGAGMHCAKLVLRNEAGLPGSAHSLHDVNLLSVASPGLPFVQRAKICKQSRFDKNVVLPAPGRVGGGLLAVSVVVPLGDLASGISDPWRPFIRALEAAAELGPASSLEVVVVGWGSPSVPLPWRLLLRTRVLLARAGSSEGDMLDVGVRAARAEWVLAGQPGWAPAATLLADLEAADAALKAHAQVLLLHHPAEEAAGEGGAGVEECHASMGPEPPRKRGHAPESAMSCRAISRRTAAQVLAGALEEAALWPAFLGSEMLFRRELGLRAGFPADSGGGGLALWGMLAAAAARGHLRAAQVAALRPPPRAAGEGGGGRGPPPRAPAPLARAAAAAGGGGRGAGLAPAARALRRAAARLPPAAPARG